MLTQRRRAGAPALRAEKCGMNDIDFARRYYDAWNVRARSDAPSCALYAEDIEFSLSLHRGARLLRRME